MGDAFSLEQRLQLGEGAGMPEKLEITLLNLVLPLLLLVGSGRKVVTETEMGRSLCVLCQDVPKLRRSDVKYILHLLLRVVKSGKHHPSEHGHQNNSSSSNNRQNNNPPNSVKIGFLGTSDKSHFPFSIVNVPGLRILLTCYKDSLTKEWLSIAATIR